MGRILLEVCCGSADDVIEAHRGGADRVELNCDLFHGGLTIKGPDGSQTALTG